MKIETLCPYLGIRPWKPKLKLVPHFTIETNMTCNFKCHTCYNLNTSYTKELTTVLEEIDTGLRMRKADTITLMGGEPTLYPDLTRVIRYIKSKGVFSQMLTNGFLIYQDPEDQLLKDLADAGLDRIVFHVDRGQEQYPDPLSALHTLFRKTEKYDLLTSISWTIYNNEQGYLPDLIREFAKYKKFDGILALLEKPMDIAVLPGFRREEYPNLLDEHRTLRNQLLLQPSVYLPNSRDDESVSWLVYMYFINTGNFRTFYLSPRFTRFFQSIYTFLFRREMFGKPPMRSMFGLSLLLAGSMEVLMSPRRIRSFFRLFRGSDGFKNLRFHYLAIQDSPSYDSETEQVSICYACPDATVRNGKLTPVCLADRINPLTNGPVNTRDYQVIRDHVFTHLEQNHRV